MRKQSSSFSRKINFQNIFFLSWLIAFVGPILASLISNQANIMRPWLYAVATLFVLFSFCRKNQIQYQVTNKVIYFSLFLTGILFILYPISRYFAVETNGFDFSVFDWMTRRNYYNEIGFEPVHSLNHYSIHASWVLIPITLFRLYFDHPVWLIGFGGFVVWLTVVPLWFLSLLMTKDKIFSLLICFVYLTNSVISATLNSFFRIECLYPLALFSFLLAWERGDRRFWIPALLFFLSIKEDAALYLVGFSLYLAFFSKSNRKLGVFMMAISLLVFLLNTKYLQPMFATSVEKKQFLTFWSGYGTDLKSIIIAMITSPLKVFNDILHSGWWKIYLMLGFIPLFSLRVFLFSLPGIFLLGTASGSQDMHQYSGYYPVVLLVLALFGCIEFMSKYGEGSLKLRNLCFIVLLIFPLHHASSIRFDLPNFQLYKQLQETRSLLSKYPQHQICVQASLIPYLGYDLPIKVLTKECVELENSILVLSEVTKPYPFHKNEITDFIHQSHAKTSLRKKSSGITVLVPKKP